MAYRIYTASEKKISKKKRPLVDKKEGKGGVIRLYIQDGRGEGEGDVEAKAEEAKSGEKRTGGRQDGSQVTRCAVHGSPRVSFPAPCPMGKKTLKLTEH